MKVLLPLISLFVISPAMRAQTAQQAETFVRQTYLRYERPALRRGPEYLRRDAPSVFSPSLVGLIRRDQHNTPKGDVGKLDFDPICACQDPDGLKLAALTIKPTTSGRAIADVNLHYPEPAVKQLQLDLLWTPAGWRINDIESKEMSSLRKLLR